MCSTCWSLYYEEQLELLHSCGRHKLFKYCIFYNQTFRLRNMHCQKESHIEASAKVNEKFVPNVYFPLMLIVIALSYWGYFNMISYPRIMTGVLEQNRKYRC